MRKASYIMAIIFVILSAADASFSSRSASDVEVARPDCRLVVYEVRIKSAGPFPGRQNES